jgi:hypothetical protein
MLRMKAYRNKKTREDPGLILKSFDVLWSLCSDHTFFTDPGALATTLTLVEQFGAANITHFIHQYWEKRRGKPFQHPHHQRSYEL